MKYIGKYADNSAIQNAVNSGELVKPYVAYNVADDVIDWNGKTQIQPNDEIWYTSTDGNIVEPLKGDEATEELIPIPIGEGSDLFGANIISNTYKDGKGIIKFDGDVSEIGTTVFATYSTLLTIEIPDSVTSIGIGPFNECSSLISVNIPNLVTNIGGFAFKACPSLTSVTIPHSVTNIDYYAFDACSGLTSVTCLPTTPPTLNTNVFRNTNDCPIYVPRESVEAYKTTTNWLSYSSRIKAIPE